MTRALVIIVSECNECPLAFRTRSGWWECGLTGKTCPAPEPSEGSLGVAAWGRTETIPEWCPLPEHVSRTDEERFLNHLELRSVSNPTIALKND